jgi:hypothetical protein
MRAPRLLFVVSVIVGTASAAVAQDLRFYLAPKIGSGVKGDAYRPKYFDGMDKSAMDFGMEPVLLVGARPTAVQEASLAAHLDVIVIPLPLDSLISPLVRPTVQARLESLNLPGNALTETSTYRDLVRLIARMCFVAQRYHGLFLETPFANGVTLETKLNQMGAEQRQRLFTAMDSLNVQSASVTTAMALREAFAIWLAQIPPIAMEGELF